MFTIGQEVFLLVYEGVCFALSRQKYDLFVVLQVS